MFRDVIDFTVQGGRGGDGAMSFLRLKYVPKGGPDGGHGGHGGHVALRAIDDVGALARLTPNRTYQGGTGMQGEGRERNGKAGEPLVLEVPVGTLARDLDTGRVIADLTEVGQEAVVAEGGEGGRGNASFANSTRRAPRFSEYGGKGARRRVRLELRTIADAGLVGYPNAGKSSLLAALSNAKPVIADYPFTTLTPNLGVVERGDGSMARVTLADVPGLIEGAHEGKGLGHEFLRHVSRTRLLAWVLDIADDPPAAFRALRREVGAYDPTLLDLPGLIVLHKIDLASDAEVRAAAHDLAEAGLPVVPASSTEGRGLDDVREALFALLPERPEVPAASVREERIEHEPIRVERLQDGGGWIVRGSEAEALLERFDATNADAVEYLQRHFERMGLSKALRRAGAQDGDDVWIGEAAFEYFDEAKARDEERDAARRAREADAAEAAWSDDGDGDDDGDDDGADGSEGGTDPVGDRRETGSW